MIMISSKAGQQWAKAFAAFEQAKKDFQLNGSYAPYFESLHAFEKASSVLGKELIANGHHLVEGD